MGYQARQAHQEDVPHAKSWLAKRLSMPLASADSADVALDALSAEVSTIGSDSSHRSEAEAECERHDHVHRGERTRGLSHT